jgi:hypothetical protein
MRNDLLTNMETTGYEPRDVNTRGLVYFLGIVALFLVATSFAVQWLFGYFVKTDRPAAVVQPVFSHIRPLPLAPRVQVNPENDIQEYLNSEKRFLNSSGWIDKKNGIARIPIDRAIELLLQQGLPVRSQNVDTPPPNANAPGEHSHR